MGEKGVDLKIIKKTQDSLGKIIKKPPLTEKLLTKPPFRFIHDVMTSVIKSTGFMKGLFVETELNSDNVKDKDSKVAFLQKVLDMVSLVLGKTIAAKPSKIVAGQEADKTNELLQLLAEAIHKKVNNDEYVQRVLKGGGDTKPASGKKDPEKKKKEKEDDKKAPPKDKDRKDRDKSRGREDREKSRDKDKERSKDKDREKSKDRRDRDKDRERDKSKDKDREDGDRHKDRDRRKRRDEREQEAEKDHGTVNGEQNGEQEDIPPRIPRPTSAKGSRRRPGHGDDSSDEEEEEHVRQRERERSSRHRDREAPVGEDDLPPQVAAARKIQRPSSARPAPPKLKKNEGQDDPVMMGSSNVPNLIVDKDDSDEDDTFMAKEDDEPAPVNIAPQRQQDTEEEGEHGGLVKKILETKKELEGGSQQPGKKTEIERSHVSDATRRKEREMIQKEIDKLRNSIQTLTRSVNPLGKILDFLQEDLDSMQKELVMWQGENKENAVALQREQSVTESSIEPLKSQMQEIDAAITDQLDLIAAVKHNTLKNDNKIEKMLSTVTKS